MAEKQAGACHSTLPVDFTRGEDGKITEKVILKIHRLLTKDVLENAQDSGVYRNRQAVVGNRVTGLIAFRPRDTREVPILMKEP